MWLEDIEQNLRIAGLMGLEGMTQRRDDCRPVNGSEAIGWIDT